MQLDGSIDSNKISEMEKVLTLERWMILDYTGAVSFEGKRTDPGLMTQVLHFIGF